ncbi:Class III chitinase [Lachnellula suecica]|uniref:chitinase n=1 Tax=Lachnellula suecica TaxID=602035 RepID=A0A8T9CC28_9HELO|nr:Class III chitinase [Lachnellula suecica]
MKTSATLSGLASLLAFLPVTLAGFNSGSSTNVAVYWGQNSYGQGTGSLAQQRLSYYCSNTNVDPQPQLRQRRQDIAECQTTYGKTILLSVGGATYTEGGFSSSAAAVTAANNIWSIFGPATSSSVPRPFGNSVIDGFDFDFESTVSNMPAFGNQLRSLMTASTSSTGKNYYLTAAPQCPYPDAADGPMLAGAVSFDAVFVQFYNNYCGVQSYVAGSSSQNNFNFATWDTWAKTVSLNPNVKVFLGFPANTGGGAGYTTGSALAAVIAYSKSFSSFGGAMMWDMSQAYANSGFLAMVKSDLGAPPATTIATTMTTVTTKPAGSTTTTAKPTTTTGGAAPTSTYVQEYDQCAGIGYTGSTVCQPPYVCTYNSDYYSSCPRATMVDDWGYAALEFRDLS